MLQGYHPYPVMCIRMLTGWTHHASHPSVADDSTSAAKPSYYIALYRDPLSPCSLLLKTLYALLYNSVSVGNMPLNC